jgi:hypothetical protein
MIVHTLRTVLVMTLSACCFAPITILSIQGKPLDAPTLIAAALGLGLAFLAIKLLLNLIATARHGDSPSVIRASTAGLLIRAPALGRRGQRQWDRRDIVDLSLRQAGAAPGLLYYIRLQVVLIGDRIEAIKIPASGTEALAVIEDNLRDILELSFSEHK